MRFVRFVEKLKTYTKSACVWINGWDIVYFKVKLILKLKYPQNKNYVCS